VDALLLRPEVTQVVYEHAALLQSAAAGSRVRPVAVPAGARVTVSSYDGSGHLRGHATVTGPRVPARVVAGGFTLLRW